MRLAAVVLWVVASLLWLPWAAALGGLIGDLASGIPLSGSDYVNPVFAFVWPVRGWTNWDIVSWLPAAALVAFGLALTGWRLVLWERDWRAPYSRALMALGILIPPLSLILLYRDARRRHLRRNAELAEDA